MEQGTAIVGNEVFALTDEQILGVEPEEVAGEQGAAAAEERNEASAAGPSERNVTSLGPTTGKLALAGDEHSGAQARVPVPQDPPRWLAERMRDPWVGEEARELWEGAQKAEREAAAYHQLFATPEEARALKEIYPGGAADAKAAAERARELQEIDAVLFGAPGKSPQELRTGRVQLIEKLHAQDPAAFREMVEAGRQLLERSGNVPPASGAASSTSALPQQVAPELANRYREFETAANAELEKSVGAAITRAMQAALPNLKWTDTAGANSDAQGAPLRERLAAAVREDVEAALKNDAALGEQVARVLSGRRFDNNSRAQVVRLIDARARQLVPGAVRRVVGSWTAATLGSKNAEPMPQERKTVAAQSAGGSQRSQRNERTPLRDADRTPPRGRLDYRKWSDEQILDM